MGHDWVLVKAAGSGAGRQCGHGRRAGEQLSIPGDKRVLANTKIVGGGTADTSLSRPRQLKAGGDYSFLCTFPGHYVDHARQVQVRLKRRMSQPAVDQRIADLLALLELEQLEVNLFRGDSRDIGSPQVFGGQVLGQALVAA